MSVRQSCIGMVICSCLFPAVCWAAAGPETSAEKPSPQGLLIVVPEALRGGLDEYVQHKTKQLPVRVAVLETILRDQDGADEPERLKRFIYDLWKNERIGYILLVGDADSLPVRYMVLDRITPAAFDCAFYPSDLYYADLAKQDGAFEDWNAQKESFHANYYGEVRGEKNKEDPINYDEIDYLPEVAVGRWPVSTVEEVKLVADKTMRYERGILEGQRADAKRIAFVCVGGWVDCRDDLDRMASRLSSDWTVVKRYYSDERKKYETPAPAGAEVVSLMNDGVGVICHAGHGENLSWHDSFALKDMEAVNNADALPIIFSAGCSTGRFATLPPYEPYVDIQGAEHAGSDHGQVFKEPPPPPAAYQKGKFNPAGLGEGLLRKSASGAVAYIGCNTGSQPCALTLMEGFVGGLKEERLGDCWNQAIRHYYAKERLGQLKPTADWYPPSVFFQGMKFMLFGDPSLVLPAAKGK